MHFIVVMFSSSIIHSDFPVFFLDIKSLFYLWKRSFQVKLKLHFLYLNSSKYDKPKMNPILKFFYTSTNCSHKLGFFGFLGLKVYEVIKLNMLITNSTRMRILRHTIQRLKLTLFDAHPLCPPCAKFYKKRQRV